MTRADQAGVQGLPGGPGADGSCSDALGAGEAPDARLLRTAIHEAGHLAGILAVPGWEPGAISIAPGRSHLGVTRIGRARDATLSRELDGRHPLGGLPAEARLFADRMLVYVTMGNEAADLLGPRPASGRTLLPPDRPAVVRSPLDARERAALDDAEAATGGLDDDSRAWSMAFLLAGREANQYLAWVRAYARRLAAENEPGILAVVGVLLHDSPVLSGPEAASIFRAARERP